MFKKFLETHRSNQRSANLPRSGFGTSSSWDSSYLLGYGLRSSSSPYRTIQAWATLVEELQCVIVPQDPSRSTHHPCSMHLHLNKHASPRNLFGYNSSAVMSLTRTNRSMSPSSFLCTYNNTAAIFWFRMGLGLNLIPGPPIQQDGLEAMVPRPSLPIVVKICITLS